MGRSVLGVDGGVWPRGMGPINAIAQREVDFCGFPIKWGPQRVGPDGSFVATGYGIFQSSGGPSEWGRRSLRPHCVRSSPRFPIKWGPQRVGPITCVSLPPVLDLTGFQSSGGPSEWGPPEDVASQLWALHEVSNQVGAPASGALMRKIHEIFKPLKFPIKWGPQRVGPF